MDDQNQVALYGRGHRLDRRGPSALDKTGRRAARFLRDPGTRRGTRPPQAMAASFVSGCRPSSWSFSFYLPPFSSPRSNKARLSGPGFAGDSERESGIPTIKELYEIDARIRRLPETQYSIWPAKPVAPGDRPAPTGISPEFNSPKWWQFWPGKKKSPPPQAFAVGPPA